MNVPVLSLNAPSPLRDSYLVPQTVNIILLLPELYYPSIPAPLGILTWFHFEYSPSPAPTLLSCSSDWFGPVCVHSELLSPCTMWNQDANYRQYKRKTYNFYIITNKHSDFVQPQSYNARE